MPGMQAAEAALAQLQARRKARGKGIGRSMPEDAGPAFLTSAPAPLPAIVCPVNVRHALGEVESSIPICM